MSSDQHVLNAPTPIAFAPAMPSFSTLCYEIKLSPSLAKHSAGINATHGMSERQRLQRKRP